MLVVVAALFLMLPAAVASTNLPMGDVDEYGTWTTPHNREMFTKTITGDITEFQSEFQKQLVKDYVPIEARVGLAFMNALSRVGDILDNSLVRFAIIFIIIAYVFWIMFEAYNMMTGKSEAKKLTEDILKKGLVIAVWIIILEQGPAQIFMWVMGPVISVGTALSDFILNSIAQSAGANLPDTCAAIREYAAANTAPNMLLDARAAADLMCVPTRLSGFFYTAVAAGWQWMIAGIGRSAFTFLVGAIFIVVFVINIWKFALVAFGVIADLFLAVMMLPFTAIAETIGKTSYKGIAGDIFNSFLALFHTQSLTARVQQFINAALYFVSLSIVIGVCAGILSGAVTGNLASSVPSLENQGFMITLLTGLLVAYLANRASEIAKDIGGKVDDSLGKQAGNTITTLATNTYKSARDWWKIIRNGGEKK